MPDTVLMLESPAATGFDAGACIDATEAHAGGSGLTFQRGVPDSTSALSQALSRSRLEPLLAVFWFDASTDVVAIYLYAPQTHAVYLREVDRSSEAAMVEAVGLIAASTAQALRSGESLAMQKISEADWAALQADPEREPEPEVEAEAEAEPEVEAAVEPSAPMEPEPEPRPGVLRLEFAVAYRGASFNARAPWQHGIGGRFATVLGGGLVAEVGYSWLAPVDIASGPRVDLTRHEPEVALGWRWRFGLRTHLDAMGLGAVELNRWRAEGRSATRVRARIGGALRAAVEVGAGVFLEARFGARLALNRFDFVVCESPEAACSGEAREVVASGWRVAPEASVGVSYRFGVSTKK